MSTPGTAELDALIGEATVDTYDEVEAVNGFWRSSTNTWPFRSPRPSWASG